MKARHKIVLAAGIFGLLLRVIDAVLDSVYFYSGTFLELLITDVSPHELYMRSTVIVLFLIFGVIVSWFVERQARIERNLRASEEKYSSLFQSSPVGLALIGPDGIVQDCNDRVVAFSGHPRDEIVGKPYQLFHETIKGDLSISQMADNFTQLLVGESIDPLTMKLTRKDGEPRWIESRATPLKQDGEIVGIQIITSDITERVQVEQTLQESKVRFEKVIAQLPMPMAITEPNGDIEYFNDKFTAIFGYTLEEIRTAEQWRLATYPDDDYRQLVQQSWEKAIVRAAESETQIETQEWDLTCKDGSVRRVEFDMIPLGDISIIVMNDITERARAAEKVQASLQEKELLLKEIHHRVKNNLQIISSLLDLQSGTLRDQEAIQGLQDSKNRVHAMALIHEKLYQSSNLAQIDMCAYIQGLYHYLAGSYRGSADSINLSMQIDEILVDMDTAVPCGMILNELVSNALKYAYPGGESGEIRIGFHSMDDQYLLVVADNGVGLPPDLDFQDTPTLGLQIVNLLTQQLRGTIEVDSSAGAAFTIIFPVRENPKGTSDVRN